MSEISLTLENWEESPTSYEINMCQENEINDTQRTNLLFKELNINQNLNVEEKNSIYKLISDNKNLFYLPGDTIYPILF